MATTAMGDPCEREPLSQSAALGDNGSVQTSLPPTIQTTTRPPLAPPAMDRAVHSSRKRSRSSEGRATRDYDDAQASSGSAESLSASGNDDGRRIQTAFTSPVEDSRASSANGGGSARASAGGGEYSTPSRPLEPSPVATTPLAMALTPSQGRGDMVVAFNDIMLSDSEWEREIAEFGRQLDDMLSRVNDRKLVAQTAQYMRAYPQHVLRFQIKIKQRAMIESPKQAQAKLMLVYLFHEFLKLFQDEELRQIQREWYFTIDEVLHACMRDMKSNQDMKKRVFKTIARWEELGIFLQKTKQWKALVSGEIKPRRGPIRLPRTEAERLAEAPDQLQQFPPPPVTKPQDQLNRANYAYVFERSNFRTMQDMKQHWRFTAIAFIEALAKNLGITRDIALTASLFFHRVFDRGIYAKERYKFAAASIFLAAKASSKRMKLLRMVKTMHEILESPLLAGDEEILELERMQLLHYEKLVLKGVDYELSTDLPFFHLQTTLQQMPEKFRLDVEASAQSVLEELFWLPLCLTTPPGFLAEAAAYIGCRNNERIFSFSWCREAQDGNVLTEKFAKEILREYRQMRDWKRNQERHFQTLLATSSSMGGPGHWDPQEVFRPQRGGLRVDVTSIEIEAEYTQKGVNESREILSTYIDDEPPRSDSHRRNGTTSTSSSSRADTSSRNRDNDYHRVKEEPRSSTRNDDRDRDRDSSRRDYGRDRDTSRYQRNDRDRDGDRDRTRDRDRDRDRGKPSDRESDRTRIKDEPKGSIKEEPTGDRDRKNDRTRGRDSDGDRKQDRDRERSPRDSTRSRDFDRDRKRDSDRNRDESRSRDTRDRNTRDRDRDRDRDSDRDRKGSRRSRSRSPRDSSRSSKRKHRSTSRSRSKSRSRDRSSRSSRTDDRKRSDRERDRGRDRKRSHSSSRDKDGNRGRDRDRERSRQDDRNDKRTTERTSDRDSVKIKDEKRSS